MKILFTADIHIRLGQKNVPVNWAKNRFFSFVEQLCAASEKVDLVVIGGDTFDRIPSIEELELYFHLVDSLPTKTIIFSGNHEATKKRSTFLSALSSVTNSINPKVTIVTEVTTFDWGHIVPYCFIKDKSIFTGLSKDRPVFTHVRAEIPPHVKPEIDLTQLQEFPIVYAGDLHSHSNSQANIIYPGSPMTTSFHRSNVPTGYITLEGTEWEWHSLDLPQLIRKTVEKEEDIVPTEYDHTIYVLEGSVTDLSSVKDKDLLDKKVVKRSTETSLILTKDMSISEELAEYLLYILELPEEEVHELVGEFNDNIKEH